MRNEIIVCLMLFICSEWLGMASEGLSFEDKDRLFIKASDYIVKHSTDTAEKKWQKEWENSVLSRCDSSNEYEEDAANDILIDWLTPLRNQKEWSKYQVLKMSRIFCYYFSHKWELPGKVKKVLTKELCDIIVKQKDE